MYGILENSVAKRIDIIFFVLPSVPFRGKYYYKLKIQFNNIININYKNLLFKCIETPKALKNS